MTKYIHYLSILIFLVSLFSCANSNSNRNIIDLNDTTEHHRKDSISNEDDISVAIASMSTPKETFNIYGKLIDYVAKHAGHSISVSQRRTYEEVNKMLENSEVEFAFICSGAYVYESKNVKLLAIPIVKGKNTYNSYIITQKNSKINNFLQLRNHSFAFTDPLSNTGRMYPLNKLYKYGINKKKFFSKTIYTHAHDLSIQIVNAGIYDAAAVHSLIFDYIKEHEPDKVKNIKIIDKSPDFGMPPIVAPKNFCDECFKNYQQIFLNMNKDSIGRKILNDLRIDKYVIPNDSIYKSVYLQKEEIENGKKKNN